MTKEELRAHLQAVWPDGQITEWRWTLGPVEENVNGFRVLRVEPPGSKQPWIYLSYGACNVDAYGERYEFMILAPCESPEHVETLAMVANFHADQRYRLGLGRIIDAGRGWIEGSGLTNFLVSLPYPYGPRLEHIGDSDVRILWLLPISTDEAQFAREKGVEALETRFDELRIPTVMRGHRQFDCMDPNRASVVEI
jgi:hypothetical protein